MYLRKQTAVALMLPLLLLCRYASAITKKEKLRLYYTAAVDTAPRAMFGVGKLRTALQQAGYRIEVVKTLNPLWTNVVVVDFAGTVIAGDLAAAGNTNTAKEGFSILSNDHWLSLRGADASGILYGCLELADRLKTNGKLPEQLEWKDQPEMVLRGACIGLQKPAYLPGRGVYEYPYTPETFPWFYDRQKWLQTLDSMVENRMNTLYLWNGHPFASLVKLPDYPYAMEVPDSTFEKNEAIYRFLTTEADRRGIWVIQMFYNILVSKPFAEHHNIKTQDRNRPIVPVIADYTRKSIAAFVAKYPNVGLMLALGEAMEGVGQDDIDWFTKTIIPGVKDGLNAIGKKEEPPIVLRAHDTDAPAVMKAALPLYKNLYTEAKFNGEALTTYAPRGSWAELHRTLSNIGTVQIENVHILANLEPFRYGSAHFIQKSVQAMHRIYQANGLHLYPESSYWDWPYSADKASPRLLQIERDWAWYRAWSRYAWNSNRDSAAEDRYWAGQLGSQFGAPATAGAQIARAYNESGEIAPKLLRRYGITDGNRQTLTLGMLMTQLINPFRYGLFTLLYTSESPEGEMIVDYAEKASKGEPHIGETPVQIADEVLAHGRAAVKAINQAMPFVKKNKAEFMRLRNDMNCYQELAAFYAWKARAAVQVLKYKYHHRLSDLEQTVPLLQNSVDHFEKLVALTRNTYLYANSMQTGQRKIPVPGTNGSNKTWVELLPFYQQELSRFKHHLDSLKTVPPGSLPAAIQPLTPVKTPLLTGIDSTFPVRNGISIFADSMVNIAAVAPELIGLEGLYTDKKKQQASGTHLQFTCTQPVILMIGFFKDKNPRYAPAPQLETDASANDYGQAEIKIANAVILSGMPGVNVHAYLFSPGRHTLDLPKGIALLFGFADGTRPLKPRDAGLTSERRGELDWLFE